MRFGNYQINPSEIHKGVWVFLGALLTIVVFVLFFAPEDAPPPAPLTVPAVGFEPERLDTLDTDGSWINPLIESYGAIGNPQSEDNLRRQDNQGIPLSMKVYIPPAGGTDAPELEKTYYGWTFTAGYFIPPAVSFSAETGFEQFASDDIDPIQLAIAPGQGVTPGSVYQVTGILWWRSDQVSGRGDFPADGVVTPTVLVSSIDPLSETQTQAPAEYVAPINQVYKKDPYVINLKHIEWAPGRQVRLCMTVINRSSGIRDNWLGAVQGNTKLTLGGGAEIESSSDLSDRNSALTQSELNRDIPATGYILFGELGDGRIPSGSPEDNITPSLPLRLDFPNISSDAGRSSGIVLAVSPSQFIPLNAETSARVKPPCSLREQLAN